jgi:hypothetical protein
MSEPDFWAQWWPVICEDCEEVLSGCTCRDVRDPALTTQYLSEAFLTAYEGDPGNHE